MRVGKAKRRWLRWCRYIQKTQSESGGRWSTGVHAGQALAYEKVMNAHRWAPHGLRAPWYPRWADPR